MSKSIHPFFVVVGAIAAVFMVNHFIAASWTSPTNTPPQNNVAAPLNVGADAQVKSGKLGISADNLDNNYGLTVGDVTNALGIKTSGSAFVEGNISANGQVQGTTVCIGSDCRNSWAAVQTSIEVPSIAVHDFPYGTYTDPYLRDSKYFFPYVSFTDAVDKFGIDPENAWQTKWFTLGYSYWQPYTPTPAALFMEEGDNGGAFDFYWVYSPPYAAKNVNDVKIACSTGVLGTSSYEYYAYAYYAAKCEELLAAGAPTTYLEYEDSADIAHGSISFEVRMTSAEPSCQGKAYLPGLYLSSGGDPAIVSQRINGYQLPANVPGDPCYGGMQMSVIQGRFAANRVADNGLPATNIQNFSTAIKSAPWRNYYWMIKSLGVSYLRLTGY